MIAPINFLGESALVHQLVCGKLQSAVQGISHQ